MKQINITEFRKNMTKYARLVQKEDIEVLNKGEAVFIVKSPESNRNDAFISLMASARSELPYEDILKEKLNES